MQGIVWLKLLFYVMTAQALSSCILLLTDSQWGQNYFDVAFDFFQIYVKYYVKMLADRIKAFS